MICISWDTEFEMINKDFNNYSTQQYICYYVKFVQFTGFTS